MATTELDLLDLTHALLREVLDDTDKLDVAIHLCRNAARLHSTAQVAAALGMRATDAGAALGALHRAGVVRSPAGDDGWKFERHGRWTTSVEVVCGLYELDRTELVDLIRLLAFDRLRHHPPPNTFFVRPSKGKPS